MDTPVPVASDDTRAGLRPVRLSPALLAAAVVVVVGAVRLWLGTRISTPWLYSDELVHSELAKSIADGRLFEIRGEETNITYGYPVVISPAWLFSSQSVTYGVAKAIGVVLVSSAAIPVYLWAKRLVSSAGAAVAAVLAVLVPGLTLSGTLMQENLAYPAFLFAALALERVLEAPTRGRLLALLAAAGVASATRFELALVLAVVPTAIVLAGIRSRRLLALLGASVATAAGVGLFVWLAGSTFDGLVRTFPQTTASYGVASFLEWLLWGGVGVVLATGVAPTVALALISARRWGGARLAAERRFLAIAWASVLWFLVLAGLSGRWDPYGLKERYVFYLEPLSLIALVVWAERAGPRHFARGVAIAVAAGAMLVFPPYERLLTAGSLPGNALGVEVFRRLGDRVGYDEGLGTVVVVAAVGLAALMALVARRQVRVAVVAGTAVFLAVASAFAAHRVDRQAAAVAATSQLPADHSWIDASASPDANVVLLNTTIFMPETAAGDYWPIWAPWWATQIWNRSARGVHGLGAPEPLPLRQSASPFDWRSGIIAPTPPSDWILSDPRFRVAGRERAASEPFVLYDRIATPFRLVSAQEGVFRDGRSAPSAAYDRWPSGGTDPRRIVVHVGWDGALGQTSVEIVTGTLTADGATPFSNGAPAAGRSRSRATRTSSSTSRRRRFASRSAGSKASPGTSASPPPIDPGPSRDEEQHEEQRGHPERERKDPARVEAPPIGDRQGERRPGLRPLVGAAAADDGDEDADRARVHRLDPPRQRGRAPRGNGREVPRALRRPVLRIDVDA